jgi:hypothetical protein
LLQSPFVARATWRLGVFSLRAAGLALVAFHVWLLASMHADGRLADPAVAFKWLIAAGLAAALAALWHAGIPMVRSRQGAVVWVLVALLHTSAFAAPPAPVPGQADTGALLFVLPATAAGFVAALTWLASDRQGKRLASRERAGFRPLWRVLDALFLLAASPSRSTLVPRAPPFTVVFTH